MDVCDRLDRGVPSSMFISSSDRVVLFMYDRRERLTFVNIHIIVGHGGIVPRVLLQSHPRYIHTITCMQLVSTKHVQQSNFCYVDEWLQ